MSPDVFGALAVAGYVERCCEIDYPLIVAGSGGKSASGSGAVRKHKGGLKEALRSFPDLEWPALVPAFYSVETVWAQASWIALERMGRADLAGEFNFPLLYAQCLTAHPDFAGCTLRAAARYWKSAAGRRAAALATLFGELARTPARRLRCLLPRLLPAGRSGSSVVDGLEDIDAAVRGLEDHLRASRTRPPVGWRVREGTCTAG